MAKRKKKDVDLSEMERELSRIMGVRTINITFKVAAYLVLFVFVVGAAISFSAWKIYEAEKTRLKNALIVQENIVKYVFTTSKNISYETARNITYKAMQTGSPVILLSIAARSKFNPTRETVNSIGLCSVPVQYEEELIRTKIIVNLRDLYDPIINIKAAAKIWDVVWASSDGDIKKALGVYFCDETGTIADQILQTSWHLIYMSRQPGDAYE